MAVKFFQKEPNVLYVYVGTAIVNVCHGVSFSPKAVVARVVALQSRQFYGKSGARLDKFGANLAAASLPGQGHRALHNKL